MSGALAVFVKTPGRSALKTRLAASHGEAFVHAWYALAATAVAAVARDAAAASAATVYWAVAETEALRDPLWSELPTIAQGAGSLGERMHQVHTELVARHGAGILLGADTPQLRTDALVEALHWLSDPAPHMALAPAADGGFWLFGGNRAIAREHWLHARYSEPDTAEQLRSALAGSGAWLCLQVETDVDTASDLAPCVAALQSLPSPHPAQAALLAWMTAPSALRIANA
jgi:glycosyltransferase A (GT-A) superfamily protein (DUF2064 family)